MALTDQDKELLKKILQKRTDNIPLDKEEEKFVTESWDKLMDAKRTMSKKDWFVITGDQLRNIKKSMEPGKSPNTVPPTRPHEEAKTDKKIENDDPSGKIKADYVSEEFSDTDNKRRQVYYEQDRMADILEGKHDVKDSFRIGSIVVREYNGGKELGKVMSISKNGGMLCIWQLTKTQTYETPNTVKKVYRAKLADNPAVKKEDEDDGVDEEEMLDNEETKKLASDIETLGKKVDELEQGLKED